MDKKYNYFELKKQYRKGTEYPEDVNGFFYETAKRFNDNQILDHMEEIERKRLFGAYTYYQSVNNVPLPMFTFKYQYGIFKEGYRAEIKETTKGFGHTNNSFLSQTVEFKNKKIEYGRKEKRIIKEAA